MNSEPRLNKLPFILTDAGCLVTALLIGLLVKDPVAPVPLILITSLVIAGGIALLIPYLADYAADSREAGAKLRDELELQTKRVQAASESLSRAAAQIKAVEEAVQKSAREAETLPYRMQEKLAEFNEALSEKENEDREALERELEELRAANTANLKAVAERVAKTTGEWSALEVATRKQLHTAQDAAEKLDAMLGSALGKIDLKIAELEKALARAAEKAAAQIASVPAPSVAAVYDRRNEVETAGDGGHRPPPQEEQTKPIPEPVIAAEPPPPEPPPIAVVEAAPLSTEATPTVTEEAAAPIEPPKPKKPRAPRKPKPEETLSIMSDVAATVGAEGIAAEISAQAPVLEKEAEVVEHLATTGVAPVEASASSDGATRLLATAYIGIGNKLFIRGDGPGLSWERGVPMQFVSIGKWGWSSHEANGPVRVKLYKNDESAALSGEITLEPGRHTEVTALF